MLVSIDPGVNQVAFAAWATTYGLPRLDFASAVKSLASPGDFPRSDRWGSMGDAAARVIISLVPKYEELHLVTEIPQVYKRGSGTGDPNDLVDLAGVVGALVGGIRARMESARVVWSPVPREWKGQLPKEVTQARVDAELSDGEKARIKWSGEKHNIYDAIHLGLVHFKRTKLRGHKSS
jgi:hypothetical protein